MSTRTRSGLFLAFVVAATATAGCTRPPTVPPPTGGSCASDVTGTTYRRGPDPTLASVSAAEGPFAISQTAVTGQTGFAGGTIYHPNDTSAGTFGGIVMAPPYMVNSSANAAMSTRLASHGFVVLAFDANSTSDFPTARATQAKAALGYLTDTSPVRTKVDRNRLAIGGFSMGGGATLEVARDTPALKAALPMVPWNSIKTFSTVQVPTMILAAQNDSTATVADHALPFFTSIPASTPKAYVEVQGAAHFMPASPPPSIVRYSVSWMKRWVDNDSRYSTFLSAGSSDLSTFRSCFASS